jgi:hypothetical protein
MIILILYGNITIQLSNSKTTIHISGIIVYEEKYINIEYEMIFLHNNQYTKHCKQIKK